MALVNMKMSKEEAKEQSGCAPAPADMPRYPYGLSLSLDDDALTKLGIGNDVNVGDEVEIVAKAIVQSKSGYQTMVGDPENNLSLQITDMEVSSGSTKTTKTLYDKK